VVGLAPDYPSIKGHSYTPPTASDYLAMLDMTGIAYGAGFNLKAFRPARRANRRFGPAGLTRESC
jgi:hypothetical protein